MRILPRKTPGLALVLAAVGVATCSEPARHPSATGGPRATLSFTPVFSSAVTEAAAFYRSVGLTTNRVRVIVTKPPATVLKDTSLAYDPSRGDLQLDLVVPTLPGDQLEATLEYLDNNITLFRGTATVTALPLTSPSPATPTPIQIVAVGPGATASRVVLSPTGGTFPTTAPVTFTATVFDQSNAIIPNPLLTWNGDNPAAASVGATGIVTPTAQGGTVKVRATTLNGVFGEATITFLQPPARIVVVSGGGQTAEIGQALPAPLVVEVQTASGTPVANQGVTFSASGNATVGTPTATTGANGRAQTTMTLGTTPGSYTFTAISGTFNVTATATATAAPPSAIAIVSGDAQSDTIKKALKNPFVVKVTDRLGNPKSGVAVAWLRTSGTGSVSAASTTTGADGTTSITYTLGDKNGSETVTATAAGIPTPVTFTATAISGGVASIAIVSGDGQSGIARTLVTNPLVVELRDAGGNPVANTLVAWSVTQGTATLEQVEPLSSAEGRSSAKVRLGVTPGTIRVRASVAGRSVEFTVTSTLGTATKMRLIGPSTLTVTAGASVSVLPKIEVTDDAGNPVPAVPIKFVLRGGNPQAPIDSLVITTDASGIASFTGQSGTIEDAGIFALVASNASLTPNSITIDVTVNPASAVKIGFLASPGGTQTAGQTLPATKVAIMDQFDNVVPAASGSIALSFATNPPGATLLGTTTVATSSGVATFSDLSITRAGGPYSFTATLNPYPAVTSVPFGVQPAAPAKLVLAVLLQTTATSGTPLAPQPQIQITDTFGNPVQVAAANVAATVSAGSLSGTTTIPTNANGRANFTNVAINGSGSVTLTFSSGTLTPVTSPPITVNAGVATTLTVTPPFAANDTIVFAAGTAPSPRTITITDGNGNPVPNFGVRFIVKDKDSVAVRDTTAFTDASGQVSSAAIGAAVVAGRYNITAAPSNGMVLTGSPLRVPARITPGPAAKYIVAVSNLNPPAGSQIGVAAQLTDAFDNRVSVSGRTVTWTSTNGGTFSTPTSPTDTGGKALITFTVSGTQGTTHVVTATEGSLTGNSPTITTGAGAGPAAIVLISGNNQTVTAGSPSAPFVVEVRNGSGAPVAGVTVNWQVIGGVGSVGTGAPTAADGRTSVVYTPSNNGPHVVRASVVGVAGTVDFSLNAVPAGTTATWTGLDGTSPRAWSVAANWSPAVVPGPTSNVFIPSLPSTRWPLLSSSTGVASLILDAGTNLDLGGQNLVVGTNIDARGNVLNGLMMFPNGGTTIRGNLTVGLYVDGDVSLVGPTASGGLTIRNNGFFRANGNKITVNGGLSITESARLQMLNAADSVMVVGGAFFGGGDENGNLAAGVLAVGGNFSQNGANSSSSFRGSGTHTLVMTGNGRTITFANTGFGCCDSWIQNLKLSSAGQITINSPIRVEGNFDITSGTLVTAASVSVGGRFDSPGSTNLSGITFLEMYGGGGLPFPTIGGLPPATMRLSGSTSVQTPTTLQSNVVEVSGLLDVSTANLQLGGEFRTIGNGRLRMVNDVVTMNVAGNVTFGGGDENGLLTGGTLALGGNFAQTGSNSSSSYRGAGSHILALVGSANQAVSFTNTGRGCCDAWMRNLLINKSGGRVDFTSFAIATGNILVQSGTAITSSSTIVIDGQLDAVPGSDFSGVNRVQVDGSGSIFPRFGGIAPSDVYIVGDVIMDRNVVLPGKLSIAGFVRVGGNHLTVNGDFATIGNGRLTMVNAAGIVTVLGNVAFGGGDESGNLTAGVFEAAQSFAQTGANSSSSFRGTTAHILRLNGSATQTVSFTNPGFGCCDAWIQNLEITNTQGVTFGSFVRILGDLAIAPGASVTGSRLTVEGTVNVGAAANLSALALLELLGNGTDFPVIAGTGPTLTRVVGTTNLAGTRTINGNVEVTGLLDVLAQQLSINGTFATEGNGRLKMVDPAARVAISGNATFRGGDENGLLSGGILSVAGDLSQQGPNSSSSFRGTGTHVLRLNGATNQSMGFTNTGFGCCDAWIQNLEIATTGTATFTSPLRVEGNVNVTSAATIVAAHDLHVGGVVTTAAGSSMTGLQALRLYGSGVVFPSIAGTAPPLIGVSGSVTVNGTASLPSTTLEVTGLLDVSAATVNLGGNFSTQTNGRLRMTAGSMTVNGNALFRGGDETNHLTGGTLTVKGNFTQDGPNSSSSYRGTGTHKLVLGGSSLQAVSFTNTGFGCCDAWLQDLEVTNPTTVAFNSVIRVEGNLSVNAATTVTSTGDIHVAGVVTTTGGSSLSGVQALRLYGSGVVFPNMAGSAPPLIGISGSVTVNGLVTLPSTNLEVTGTLNASNASLTLGGNFATQGNGRLVIAAATGAVTVNGNALFRGGDETGSLTDGTLMVKGNLTQDGANSSSSFRAAGKHKTILLGAGAQTVTFTNPGFGCCDAWFSHLEINKPSGSVAFGSLVRIDSNFVVNSSTAVSSNNIVWVAGNVSTVSGSSLAGVLALELGGTIPFPTFGGTPAAMTRVTSSGKVTVSGASTIAGPLEVFGNLTLHGTLTVNSHFATRNNGVLVDTVAAGVLIVADSAVFHGGDESAKLTNGLLEVRGNFRQNGANSGSSFRSAGSHVLKLSGSSAQTLQFQNGGTGCCDSWIQNLAITNSSATGVSISGFARVMGNADNFTKLTVPGAQRFDVEGTFTLKTGSTTTNLGTLNAPNCVNQGGSTSGWTCGVSAANRRGGSPDPKKDD